MGLMGFLKPNKSENVEPEISLSILVVSDDPPTLSLIETILKDAGYAVLSASGIKEALQLLDETGLPSAFIGDFAHPEADAKEFLDHAQNRFGKLMLPHTMLLMDSPEDEIAANAMGVYDLLPKPFEAEKLLQCVKDLTAHTSTSTPQVE